MFTMSICISKEYYEFVLEARKKILFDYECQKIDCLATVKAYPDNSVNHASEKIRILNACYRTRVPNQAMAEHIAHDIGQIDWQTVDEDILGKIAHISIKGKNHDYFSFATKYCALHSPDRFPIYDSLVWAFFCELNKQGFFDASMQCHFKNVNDCKSNAYRSYIAIYDTFINLFGLRPFYGGYRQVDYFLWGLIVIALRVNRSSIPSARKQKSSLFEKVFNPIASGIIANAIWDIISQIIKSL